MEEVTLEGLPKQTRDMFNRGFTALERGNIDYAIDMLTACVTEAPRFIRAWKFLRAAEIKRYRRKPESGALGKLIADAVRFPSYLSVMALLKSGKNLPAMMMAERVLRNDPLNPKYSKLFAQTAAKNDLPEVAIMTLETAREGNPDDISILNWLGMFYQKMGRTRSARECFERLCELCPNDPAALKQLKDAMALDSMSGDGWEKTAERGGSFRDMLKDGDEAALLEQESKSSRSDTGLDTLIADMIAKIKVEPMNINYRRGLANLYLQKRLFAQAIAVLEEAVKMNPGDPELERTLSNAHLREFDSRIEILRETGDETTAAALENERLQFKFDDLQGRVERYPNDLQLRFEWGVMLFENEYGNEAIQQLQLAQRSAKNRVPALYYLGLCFKSKRQYDVALRQLESSLSELPIMDTMKKKVLYELGTVYELMGNPQKASDYYMQIYQADIGYLDVAGKIEQFYQQSSE